LVDWALSDQLVFATVSSLLRLATIHADYSDAILNAVLTFSSNIVSKLQGTNREDCFSLRVCVSTHTCVLAAELLAQFAPSFHGFYRALTSTTYAWSPKHWIRLSNSLNPLFKPSVIDSLNRLVADIVQLEETDPDTVDFISSLVARYVSRGRPLSGYFLVCCVIEMQWTVLAQALTDAAPASQFGEYEAAAANNAWTSLLESTVIDVKPFGVELSDALKNTLQLSMQSFTDLLVQIEEMDLPPSPDSYAWETMSESLVCEI
jgi:phosphatidylinositol 4-kinase A